MKPFFQTPDKRVTVEHADCLDWMRAQADNSIAGFCTDSPYGISFMSVGWDHDVPGPAYWKEALRIAKPGAFLFAFGGTRTFHRLTCAIEDAGWEIRDCIMWVYSSGMLKGQNISKAIDKAAIVDCPDCAAKGCENCNGTGKVKGAVREVVGKRTDGRYGRSYQETNNCMGRLTSHKSNIHKIGQITKPATPLAQRFEGRGTCLAPAHEPVIVAWKNPGMTFAECARVWDVAGLNLGECGIETHGKDREKHLKEWQRMQSTKAKGDAVMDAGFAAINLSGYAKPYRAAKNLLHDNSPQVLELFPQVAASRPHKNKAARKSGIFNNSTGEAYSHYSDSGSAARFYKSCLWTPWDKEESARFLYCPKASKAERGRGNDWPTVKPIKLMRYLLRLLKQPGDQLYCDPFGGSGSTAVAAMREGMRFVVVDKNLHACEISAYRLGNENLRLF